VCRPVEHVEIRRRCVHLTDRFLGLRLWFRRGGGCGVCTCSLDSLPPGWEILDEPKRSPRRGLRYLGIVCVSTLLHEPFQILDWFLVKQAQVEVIPRSHFAPEGLAERLLRRFINNLAAQETGQFFESVELLFEMAFSS
jgi:hypothetical protein